MTGNLPAVPEDAAVEGKIFDGEVVEEAAAPGLPTPPAPVRAVARGEEWRPAPGWSAYEVSSRGRVRSVDRVLADGRGAGGKLLKRFRNKHGYLFVTLSDGSRRQDVHVARLVLFAFVGWPPAGTEACHRNGRRWDCRRANLYWGTKPENRADRERHRAERAAKTAAGADAEAGETGATAPCLQEVVSGKVDMCRSEP